MDVPPVSSTAINANDGEAVIERVVFTDTRWWAVDLDPETAEMVLDKRADIIDVADTFTRARRIDPHASPFEADLTVERAEDQYLRWDEAQVIDGTKPESYYWSARKSVMEARYHLNCGRYREGDCREMDAVNASLGRIEEELRVLAMAVDNGRAETPGSSSLNGRSATQETDR